MVAPAVTTMNDRRHGGSGASSSHHHRPTTANNGSSTNTNRLSAYEHQSRPIRTRRSRTSFTANHEGNISDVSSSLVSPTNLVHAIPRPKSPRAPRPNYSVAKFQATRQAASSSNTKQRSRSAPLKERSQTPTAEPLLAAQHFQSTVIKEPRDCHPPTPPRRGRGQKYYSRWNTTDVTISGDSTTSATTPSDMSTPSRLSPQRRQQQQQQRRSVSPKVRNRPASSRNNNNNIDNIPIRIETPEDTLLRGCIQGGLQGSALLGNKFAECFNLSADVYQQECGPHQQRGDDRMFLFRKKSSNNGSEDDDDDDEDDDIVEGDDPSLHSGSRSKLTADTDRATRPRKGGNSKWDRSRSTSPASSGSRESSSNKTPSTPYRSNRTTKQHRATEKQPDKEKTPTRRTYPRHYDSFDVAPHAIRYDQGEMPRLHATRGKTPWEESLPDATNEFVALRNLRLSMFQQAAQQPHQSTAAPAIQPSRSDGTPDIPEPAEIRRHTIRLPGNTSPKPNNGPSFPPWRLANNANDSSLNETLRKELEETKRSLRLAREDLQHAQELVVRQQADVQTRANRLTTEKLHAEAKLQEESRAKLDLLKRIGKLQEETSQLKSSLKTAQREAGGAVSPNRRPPLSPSFESRSPSPRRREQQQPQLTARNLALRGMPSPEKALADEMYDETSPTSSKDDEDAMGKPLGKRGYDSGAVLNLVREVARMSGRHGAEEASPAREGSKTTSPVSVMEMESSPESEKRDCVILTPPRDAKGNEFPEDNGSPYLSSRLIALRSELLDVRSQLAEANVARLKAENQRDEAQKINTEIQNETRKLREEVNELKQLVLTLRLKEGETDEKYKFKVQEIRGELAKAKERAAEEEKAKERLEEELTDTQNEADELRNQVAKFMAQLEAAKSESEEKIRVSDMEAKNLQDVRFNLKNVAMDYRFAHSL